MGTLPNPNPMPDPIYPCGCCNKKVNPRNKAVQCDICNYFNHIRCDGISAYEYEKMKIINDMPGLDLSHILVWEPDRGHVHPPRSKIPPMVSEAHGCPKYGLGWPHRSFWVQTIFFERFLRYTFHFSPCFL